MEKIEDILNEIVDNVGQRTLVKLDVIGWLFLMNFFVTVYYNPITVPLFGYVFAAIGITTLSICLFIRLYKNR